MAAPPPPLRRESPLALPGELVEEILLRLPPDEPACILRASLVCKAWGRAVSHHSFRRRLHERYPVVPVLGFLHDWNDERLPFFIPTTASSFSLPAPDRHVWHALDCRHGRALFIDMSYGAPELLVWEPITGGERRVPLPPVFHGHRSSVEPGAAVFCAADVCDHRDCEGGPFQLVFVFNIKEDTGGDYVTSACVYSSETGTWGEPTSVRAHNEMRFTDYSSVLVRRSLLYFLSDQGDIVEYDLAKNGLAVFDALDMEPRRRWQDPEKINLVLAEDGEMRVSQVFYPHLKFWKRESGDGLDAQWVLGRVIDLCSLLQVDVVRDELRVAGFAEGANLIFVDTGVGLFTIELLSERVRKVCDNDNGFCCLVPLVGFYTPVPRGEHQDPLSVGPSEEAGGEEGGEDEKTVEQLQLFHEGSNAIEEQDFVSVGFSHAIKTRIPNYEVPMDCPAVEHGRALQHKAQEVDDALDDVPKIEPNKESMTGAAHKDDAGNSNTSRSNVELSVVLFHER